MHVFYEHFCAFNSFTQDRVENSFDNLHDFNLVAGNTITVCIYVKNCSVFINMILCLYRTCKFTQFACFQVIIEIL